MHVQRLWDEKGGNRGCLCSTLNGARRFTRHSSSEERALYAEGTVCKVQRYYRANGLGEQKELDVVVMWAE